MPFVHRRPLGEFVVEYKHHIFLSYSRSDFKEMQTIRQEFENAGLDVWADQEIRSGSEWPIEIEQAIQNAACMVVVLSPETVKSKWVRREIHFAERLGLRVFYLLVKGHEKDIVALEIITAQLINLQDELQRASKIARLVKEILDHLNIKLSDEKEMGGKIAEIDLSLVNVSDTQIQTISDQLNTDLENDNLFILTQNQQDQFSKVNVSLRGDESVIPPASILSGESLSSPSQPVLSVNGDQESLNNLATNEDPVFDPLPEPLSPYYWGNIRLYILAVALLGCTFFLLSGGYQILVVVAELFLVPSIPFAIRSHLQIANDPLSKFTYRILASRLCRRILVGFVIIFAFPAIIVFIRIINQLDPKLRIRALKRVTICETVSICTLVDSLLEGEILPVDGILILSNGDEWYSVRLESGNSGWVQNNVNVELLGNQAQLYTVTPTFTSTHTPSTTPSPTPSYTLTPISSPTPTSTRTSADTPTPTSTFTPLATPTPEGMIPIPSDIPTFHIDPQIRVTDVTWTEASAVCTTEKYHLPTLDELQEAALDQNFVAPPSGMEWIISDQDGKYSYANYEADSIVSEYTSRPDPPSLDIDFRCVAHP